MSQEDTMQALTRNPVKNRRHLDERHIQRSPRPVARRQGTRAGQIRAALKEA
jgi:hypothetical protein